MQQNARSANIPYTSGEDIITENVVDRLKLLAEHISMLSQHGVIQVVIRKDTVDEMEITAWLKKSKHQL